MLWINNQRIMFLFYLFSLKFNLKIGQFNVTIYIADYLPTPKWNIIFERPLTSKYVAQTEICLILWSSYFKECNLTSCFVMRYTFLIILFTFTAISNSYGKRTEHKNKIHHKKSKVEAVWPPTSMQWTWFN